MPPSTTQTYTLSLHDALPIFVGPIEATIVRLRPSRSGSSSFISAAICNRCATCRGDETGRAARSEEHTSELQSPDQLVCRLLLEKKKNNPPSAHLRRATQNNT